MVKRAIRVPTNAKEEKQTKISVSSQARTDPVERRAQISFSVTWVVLRPFLSVCLCVCVNFVWLTSETNDSTIVSTSVNLGYLCSQTQWRRVFVVERRSLMSNSIQVLSRARYKEEGIRPVASPPDITITFRFRLLVVKVTSRSVWSQVGNALAGCVGGRRGRAQKVANCYARQSVLSTHQRPSAWIDL